MRRSKSTNFIPSYSYIEEDENPQDLLRAYRMVLRDLRFVQGEVASLQEQLEKQQEESSQWTIRYTRRMVLLSNLLLGGFIFGDRCIDIMKDLVSAHSGAVWTTLWRRGKQKISTIGGGGSSSSSSSASSSSSSHLGNASGFGFNMGTSSHGASGGGTFSSFGSRRAISSSSNNNNNNGNSNAATGGRFSTLANNFNNTFSNNLNTLLSMTSIPSSHNNNNNITSGTRRHFLTAARSGSGGSSSSSQHHHHHSGGGGGSGSGSGSSLLYSHHHHHGSRPRYVIRDVMYKGLLSASLRSSIFFLAAYWITSKDRWKRGCGIVLSLLGSLYMAFRSKIAPWAIYFNICTIALYLIVRFYKYVPFLHLL